MRFKKASAFSTGRRAALGDLAGRRPDLAVPDRFGFFGHDYQPELQRMLKLRLRIA